MPPSRTRSSVARRAPGEGESDTASHRRPHRPAGEHAHAVDVQVDPVALDVVPRRCPGGDRAEPDQPELDSSRCRLRVPRAGGRRTASARRGCAATTARHRGRAAPRSEPRAPPAPVSGPSASAVLAVPDGPDTRGVRHRPGAPRVCAGAARAEYSLVARPRPWSCSHQRGQRERLGCESLSANESNRPPGSHGGRAGGESRSTPEQHRAVEAQAALGRRAYASAPAAAASLEQRARARGSGSRARSRP